MHIFHDFIHVHSPYARADNPLGPNFWCQQEGLITLVICRKFKKISSTSNFLHIFSWFNKRSGYLQSTVNSQKNVKLAIYSQLSIAKNVQLAIYSQLLLAKKR